VRRLEARGERAHLFISNLRLAVFALFVAIGWAAFARHIVDMWWLALPIVMFGGLVIAHAVQLRRLDRTRRAAAFYEAGLGRLEDRWIGTARDGARFLEDHPFARDLDLFGPASLFEMLNTTRTEAGEQTLAAWLRAAAAIDVRANQAAIHELGTKIDFREDLAVVAADAEAVRTDALAAWAGADSIGFSRGSRAVAALFAILSACAVAAVIADWIDSSALVVWLIVQSAVALVWRKRVTSTFARIGTPSRDLARVAALLARIERETFESPRLAALHRTLGRSGAMPSAHIARLQRLVSAADSTANQIFAPIAAVLLVRTQAAMAINRWHERCGHEVAAWLRVIGELEALAALATFRFEHPENPFPVLVDDGPRLEARGLSHPLIPRSSAVANDVALGGDAPRLLVVSGSNMSGKSTLLRAVGVNVVLALCGAPVRADELTLSRLAIGATLRVEDSLHAARSRFFAEILRIRDIVELTAGPVPVLFLLDEILHGTNSYDRRIGAEAIVRSLLERGAVGLITTHDLALTELVPMLNGAAANVHFEDRLENGAMVFDYRMRPGVVEHSNALALMRAVGLTV